MKSALSKLVIVMGLSYAVFIADGLAQERDQPSPRAFCQATGGSISETGNQDVFVCCYESGQKCVLNNVQRRYSRRMSNTPEERDVQIVQETRGSAKSE